MIKINPQFLSILKHRFDEQVSESDIIAWLYNFEEKDWETALILLSNVSYYSDNRCCNILESGLNRILNECENLPIVFFPIGGIGKSGGVIAYYIKKIMDSLKHKDWEFATSDNYDYKNTPHIVVLLDDFIGSGKSAVTLYDGVSGNVPNGSKVFCLCIACMQKGYEKLRTKSIETYGDIHLPAFIRRKSIFGYPSRMKPIKEFAMKYGELLYRRRRYTPQMDLYIGPLGYANCQSLVCFDHTTPNNTLPILWGSKKRADNDVRWTPIFPRKLFDRTRRDEAFYRRKYHWASIAQKISGGKIDRIFNNYSKETLSFLGLLHCKYYHRSNAYTCILLEITFDELRILEQKAEDEGLLTDKKELTQYGANVYKKIREQEFKKISLVDFQINTQKNVYLPKEFLGLSRN